MRVGPRHARRIRRRPRTPPLPADSREPRVPDAHPADARDQALLTVGRILKGHGYRFITVTPATHATILARDPDQEAQDWRDVFGWNRPFERDLLPAPLMAALRAADALDILHDGRLRARIRCSSVGERLFLHAGFPTTARDAVFFGPDTYRFIRLLRQGLPAGGNLIEIGGGSGAAALCLADRFPAIAMTDINPLAVRFARINAALNGIAADIRHADLLEGADGPYDAIIANPPYLIDPERRWYRDGGADGIGVAVDMVRVALPRLAPGGTLVLYSGAPIAAGRDLLWSALAPLLATSGRQTRYEEIDADVFGGELAQPRYAHVERLAVVSLTVGPAKAASIPALSTSEHA
jgi:hypothetical protein